ncbi:MAG TPA: alpha/beta hydrolase [Tepidisphaeraceae bacterium]|nr:alpha/beta hydrolase [Tepidisphaeraceae bacterium]
MTELALVLLPGLDGSGVMFRPLLDHLHANLRPIVVVYPKDQPLGYEKLLPLVLAALPSESPFVLLGESFSGPLALMAAATCPPGLLGVVLCATFVRNPVWFRPRWLRFLSRPMVFRMFPVMSRAKAKLAGYLTDGLRALITEALSGVSARVLAHRVRCVLEVDVRGQLAACTVPILYLRGDRDRVVPEHNVADVTAGHPLVKVVRFPAPHHVLQTQPAAAAVAIAEFVGPLSLHSLPAEALRP